MTNKEDFMGRNEYYDEIVETENIELGDNLDNAQTASYIFISSQDTRVYTYLTVYLIHKLYSCV